VLGFDRLKDSYSSCPNFSPVYSDFWLVNNQPYVDYALDDDYLFQVSQLCIPWTSFRDCLIWEMRAKGLAHHLGKDRTIVLVQDR